MSGQAGVPKSMLKRLGCYFHKEKQSYIAPSEPMIRRVLQSADMSAMESGLNSWVRTLSESAPEEAIAVDGKVLKGARDVDNNQIHLLSAILHKTGSHDCPTGCSNKDK